MKVLILVSLFNCVNSSNWNIEPDKILNRAKLLLINCLKVTKGNSRLEKDCLLTVFNNDYFRTY